MSAPLTQIGGMSVAAVLLSAPNIKGTTTDTAHFDQVVGSGLLGGFTSRQTDSFGIPNGNGVTVRPNSDTTAFTIGLSTDATTGTILHLDTTATATGSAYCLGIGVTGIGPGVSGLIVDNRNAGVGAAFSNKSTSVSTAKALQIQQMGDGVGLYGSLGTNAEAANAQLVTLLGASTANSAARLISLQNQVAQEGIYVDAQVGQLHLLTPSALRSEITWQFGTDAAGGTTTHFYVDDGTHSAFWSTHFVTTGNIFKIMQHQGASVAKGTESTNEMMRYTNGNTIGFFGSAGTTKQTISGSRSANAALASLLTALAAHGIIIDGTTA